MDVKTCLQHLGLSPAALAASGSLDAEFAAIKQRYFAAILKAHPDKGGDAAVFRTVQMAFETLRTMFEHRAVKSFTTGLAKPPKAHAFAPSAFTPSYAFYQDASAETTPLYHVELARSARSKCASKGAASKCAQSMIDRDDVRIGSLNEISGTYSRWAHVSCWRVPSRIWLGLPEPETSSLDEFRAALGRMNEVLFSGFVQLSPENQNIVCDHVMDKSNWAKLKRGKAAPQEVLSPPILNLEQHHLNNSSSAAPALTTTSDIAIQNTKESAVAKNDSMFVIPIPGVNGAVANSLSGKTVVVTGLFPEVGGGVGLNLGKDKVKAMVTEFGGRITSAISGKTDILIVGKQPGFSKVLKARARSTITMMDLNGVKNLIEGVDNGGALTKPMIIDSFSAGYTYRSGDNNGLASSADARSLAIASGHMAAPAAIQPETKSKAKAKPEPKLKVKTVKPEPTVDVVKPKSKVNPGKLERIKPNKRRTPEYEDIKPVKSEDSFGNVIPRARKVQKLENEKMGLQKKNRKEPVEQSTVESNVPVRKSTRNRGCI